MANWEKITSRGNVEDRRAFGPTAAGGLGLTGIIVYLIFNLLAGGNAGDVLNQIQNVEIPNTGNYNVADFEGADSYEVFVSTVEGSANEMWTRVFENAGLRYTAPKLVLFRGSTGSACGGATIEVGPHYCPLDQSIYLDETFFEEIRSTLGAEGGDVAEAYVIAHEIGHHAQNELGIMNEVDNLISQNPDQSRDLSIKQELQADCFAGLWAYSIRDLGVLEPGEISEAINEAKAVGDDRIQEASMGYVVPEKWTHGSSAERVEWFNRGYNSGTLKACDTFD